MTAPQAEQKDSYTVLPPWSVLINAHYHENQRDTHTIPEVAMWKKWAGGRMVGLYRLADMLLGVEGQFALVKATALGAERRVLDDEPILVMRHPEEHLSPLVLRRNKQLQQGLCLPGRSIAPTLERLDPRT